MLQVIYLGFSKLTEYTAVTSTALQQAPEKVDALTLEAHSASQFEALSNWLQHESKPGAVLIWHKPTAFIADCLAREEPIDGSLVQWKDMAQRLLKLFRRHRSQLILLGMAPGETLSPPGELPDKITDVLLQAEVTVKRLPEASPLYRLAAAQLVAEDAELQEVLAFLTGSSHASSTPHEQASEIVHKVLQGANESHCAEQQLKQLTQERDSATEENKLLLTQLDSVQEALETAQQQARTAASSQQNEQQLRKMIDERDSAQKENKLLLAQLDSVQEALETARQQASAAASSQQTEQQLKKSVDERDNAQEENELLLSQLHIVQEALEEAYIELKSGTSEAESKRLKSLMSWLRAHARRQARAAYSQDSESLQEQISLLEKSELFDAKWYLDKYKDVAKANINPIEHYIKFGAIEGRNPSPLFDTEYYVLTYPDIAASGLHPLLHYLRDGVKEQRKTQESPT
ncbi:Glycosyltransferase [Halomonas citrativorans]|uniref:Glycosyltransferase n=1 Tax=Halomonas citrativorans TaxID=2742612 RepID=A0A1R4HVI7_9GAMM|nr:hypothetical protein [Halomonas citrativorans]SJN11466.1 Glycosyltransferase [Halomonas citrativorans]